MSLLTALKLSIDFDLDHVTF